MSKRVLIECLEPRAHFSTTSYNTMYVNSNGVSIEWSATGAGNTLVGLYDDTDYIGDSLTCTLTDLPDHTMINVSAWAEVLDASDTPTLTYTFGGHSSEITYTQLDPNSMPSDVETGDGGHWLTHGGDSITVTFTGEGFHDYGPALVRLGVSIYNPTITASGGGSMTETGAGGSGSATFTVERDLPGGYGGYAAGDDEMPDTQVTVSKGGTASINDYTNAPGYDMLPDGTVTFTGVQVSKEYKIIPIDDSVAEPATPPATGPIEAETVTWTVHIPDALPPAEESLTFTASIADDASWKLGDWEIDQSPVSGLGTMNSVAGTPVVTSGGLFTFNGQNYFNVIKTETTYIESYYAAWGPLALGTWNIQISNHLHIDYDATIQVSWGNGGNDVLYHAAATASPVAITDQTESRTGTLTEMYKIQAYILYKKYYTVTTYQSSNGQEITRSSVDIGEGYDKSGAAFVVQKLVRGWRDEEDATPV